MGTQTSTISPLRCRVDVPEGTLRNPSTNPERYTDLVIDPSNSLYIYVIGEQGTEYPVPIPHRTNIPERIRSNPNYVIQFRSESDPLTNRIREQEQHSTRMGLKEVSITVRDCFISSVHKHDEKIVCDKGHVMVKDERKRLPRYLSRYWFCDHCGIGYEGTVRYHCEYASTFWDSEHVELLVCETCVNSATPMSPTK